VEALACLLKEVGTEMKCDMQILVTHPRTPGVNHTLIAKCTKSHKKDEVAREHGGRGYLDDKPIPTTINWFDQDRRNFIGELVMCDQSTCPLPAGHRGDHTK
jgi:hypothetical protein